MQGSCPRSSCGPCLGHIFLPQIISSKFWLISLPCPLSCRLLPLRGPLKSSLLVPGNRVSLEPWVHSVTEPIQISCMVGLGAAGITVSDWSSRSLFPICYLGIWESSGMCCSLPEFYCEKGSGASHYIRFDFRNSWYGPTLYLWTPPSGRSLLNFLFLVRKTVFWKALF